MSIILRSELGTINLFPSTSGQSIVNRTSQPNIVIAHPDSSASASYEIVDILGEGASGITYRAKNLQTQQHVALKALSLARIDDWKSLELFEREAQVLSKIDRDGIPKYIDYFHADVDGDRYFYIIQALAPGKTLQEWMKSGKRLTESEIKEIAIQILEHLTYLHRQKPPIVHRDLKPSNILKTDDGKVYLVDFGAVRQAYHDTFMRGSTVVGTFGYMAPEQFRGQAFPATDLYGLGATILSLLTHRSPAEIPLDGLRLNFRDRIQVSAHFADWLEQMLEPDVSKRFSSAIQALSSLKNPPKSHKFKLSFSRFERTALGACGVMGLALIFGMIYIRQYYFLSLLGLTSTEPFTLISQHSDVNKIREYLDRGFDLNAKDKDNNSLLNRAIYYGDEDVTKLLIDRGADISDRNNLTKNYLNQIEEIKNSKRYKWESEEYYRTRISRAIYNKNSYLMNSLLDIAVTGNKVEIAKLLIKKGISIQGKYNIDDMSMLHIASYFEDGEMVKLLLENGADPNIEDRNGCTPLHSAIARDKISRVEEISRLIRATEKNDNISEKSIINLLRKGANPNLACEPFMYTSDPKFNDFRRLRISPLEMLSPPMMNRMDINNLIRKESIVKSNKD
jgi:serine/threonine protein kinase